MKTLFLLLILASMTYAQPLNVIWDRSGQLDSSGYGYRILSLGDQNDDGYADWAVWAKGDGNDPSYVVFFHGGATPSETPYFYYQDDSNGTRTIYSPAVAGDLNGDSYVDWYIAYQFADAPSERRNYVYFGGPDADTTADAIFSTRLVNSLRSAGDFNGDGYDDLFLYHYIPEYFGEVYYGGTSFDTTPDWTRHDPIEYPFQSFPVGVGDLNADGYSDFVSATYPLFTTHVFLGGAVPDTVPAYTWENLDYWPSGVVKDLNGDHFDELVFGLPEHADLHFGGFELHPTADWTLNFPCAQGGPTEIVSAGDFNDDGYNDLILLNEGYCLNADWGLLSLYLGHPWIYPNPAFSINGAANPWNLVGVWTAQGLGDVNGDHIDDLAIGAYTDDTVGGLRGRVVIIAGNSGWVADASEPRAVIPQQLGISVYPNPFNSVCTIELQVPIGTNEVSLVVYNTIGQKIKEDRLRTGVGETRYTFDGGGLATGLYLLRATAGTFTTTQKLMVLK